MKHTTWLRKNWRICTAVIIGIIGFFALRFDYTYSLKPYKFVRGESLISVLNNEMFHQERIAHFSYKYLTESPIPVDINHVEANKSTTEQDGYVVQVKKNLLTLIGPDQKVVLHNAPILPPHRLYNHKIQVIYNNLVVILLTFALIWLVVKVRLDALKKTVYELMEILALVFSVPLALVIAYTIATLLKMHGFFALFPGVIFFLWASIGYFFQKKEDECEVAPSWKKVVLRAFLRIILLIIGLFVFYTSIVYLYSHIDFQFSGRIISDILIYSFYQFFALLLFYFTAFLFIESIKQKDWNLNRSAIASLASLITFSISLFLLK